MSHLTSNLLGRCPLGRKNCPYADSYCSDCITYEQTEQKKKRQNRKGKIGKAVQNNVMR